MNEALVKYEKNGIQFFRFRILNKYKDVVHFITSRESGQSEGAYASLNLSGKVGDNYKTVEQNRDRLARVLETTTNNLLFPDQCHTDHVRTVDSKTTTEELNETDALITQTKGICLCVLAADCVPVLLLDPETGTIAAIHSGWRGTVGRIVARTIECMIKKYSASPENMIAAIGPAISQKNYEAGEEVAEKFHVFFHNVPSIVRQSKPGKYLIDLKQANKELLLRYGIPDRHIEVSPICTYDTPELFYSARRDGIRSGRFATGIMLK
jgi:YfiH family protein